MKSNEINIKQPFSKIEKENIFLQLENNEDFFNEVFEAMLTYIISDPVLIYQVANAIKTDYQDLHTAIINNCNSSKENDLPSCCRTPQN